MASALRIVLGLVLLGLLALALLWALTFAGYGFLLSANQRAPEPVRPAIAFAPLTDESLADPDNPTKVFRVDLARVEALHPLSREELAGLTAAHLLSLNQEELDQLYARLTAGPIPDGPYWGDLMFARGDSMDVRIEEILGGIGGRIAETKTELAELAGRSLWKGKLFDRDERELRNFVENLRPLRALVDDPGALPTVWVPREGPLARVVPSTRVWLLFPAKLHCGQSLLDGRRESIIIDYAYSDGIAGYQPNPDALAGRHGLRIRDEIRMVRPGLYLGRAYLHKAFLLNFVLENPDVAEAGRAGFLAGEPVAEDCWPGEQGRQSASLR